MTMARRADEIMKTREHKKCGQFEGVGNEGRE